MKVKRSVSLLMAMLVLASASACAAGGEAASETPSQAEESQASQSTEETQGGGDTFEENGMTFHKTGTKISDEVLTLRGFGSKYPGNAEWDENMLLWKELEERTGIRIEWETVTNTEARSKALTYFAADDLPDILGKNALNMTDVTKFSESGQLVDFAPIMEEGLMPNFKQLYDEDVNVRIANTNTEGGIYALPCVYTDPIDTVRRFMYINDQWLENVGMEHPTTIDELLEVLRAFRDQDANGNGDPSDEYPMGLGDNIKQTEKTIYGLAGIEYVFDQPYNVVDGQMTQMYTSENMKQSFELLHTLYSENLVEQDIFTRDAPEFFARLANNQYGVTLLLPDGDSSQFGILEPTFGLNGEGTAVWNWEVSPVLTASTFNITSANQYPKATARFMDYFYGDEGATLVRMGVEGETYVVNEDGSYSYTDEIKNDPQGIQFAMANHSFWLGTNTVPGKYTSQVTLPSIEGTLTVDCPEIFEPYLSEHVYSMPQFPSDLDDEKKQLQDEINKYFSECRAAFMTGSMDIETQWEEYVQTLEQLGLDRLEEIYQEAYNIVQERMAQ